jgi:signal transduction histidine kinase
MTQLNGHSPTIMTIFTAECSPALYELPDYLRDRHYKIAVANTPAEARGLFQKERIDAIIAAARTDDVVEIFKRARGAVPPPLLVLIDDAVPPDQMADLVVSPKALHLLDYQLASFLRLRAENTHLRHELENQRWSASDISFLKSAIVRNVSHELKTPLLQVKAAVALLAEDNTDSGILVNLAQSATARLEAAVKNVSLLNELLNDTMEIRPFGPVLVSEITEYALRNLRRSWERKDHIARIQTHVPADMLPLLGDKQGLGTVLQLLLDNALKFSQEQVDVRVRQDGDNCVIAVQDKGIGIPADEIEKITEPFYQIDSSSTRRFNGMGIGLAIVRLILERHHTRLKVDSEIGKGSTFSFMLPFAPLT